MQQDEAGQYGASFLGEFLKFEANDGSLPNSPGRKVRWHETKDPSRLESFGYRRYLPS